MSIKNFVKTWGDKKELKGMSKDDRCSDLYNSIEDIVTFFLFKRYKEKETLEKIYDILATPKFVKTMAKVTKDATGDWAPDPAICLVFSDFIAVRGKDLDEEILEKYKKIISSLTAEPLKKIKKSTGLDEKTALALVSVVPSKQIIKDAKYVGRYVQNLEKVLYAAADRFEDKEYVGINIEEFSHKTLATLVKTLFEKEYKNAILLSIALDRKAIMANFTNKQLSIWNVFTYYLTEQLEEMDKKEIKEFLEAYVEARSKDAKENRDAARRINFAQIQPEDNKNIAKVVSKLLEKDKEGINKKYL